MSNNSQVTGLGLIRSGQLLVEHPFGDSSTAHCVPFTTRSGSNQTMNLAPALCTASATGLSPSGKRVESIVQLPFVFAHDLPLR